MATIEELIALAEKQNVDPVELLSEAFLTEQEPHPFATRRTIRPGSLVGQAIGLEAEAEPEAPSALIEEQGVLSPRGIISARADQSFIPTEEEEDTDSALWAIPRGITRGAVQTALSMGEGLFSLADIALDTAGFEDAIDAQQGEAFQWLRDAGEWVGHEKGMVGKLSQALGSMILFAIPGLGQAGVAGRGAAMAGRAAMLGGAEGAAMAAAAKNTLNLAKGLSALKWTAAGAAGAGEANQMLEAYEKAGGDYTKGKRALSALAGVGIGFTELVPIEIILRGLPKGFDTGSLVKRMVGHLTSGGLEGAQEAAAGIMQELAAKTLYDPDRPLGESALSDFGYGSGAGTIFSLMFRNRGRMPDKPRSEGELREEHLQTPPLDPVSPETLEEPRAVYGPDGEEYQGKLIGDPTWGVVQMAIEKDGQPEIVDVPREPHVGIEGYSFYSDEELLSSRYSIPIVGEDGKPAKRELGDFSTAQLAVEREKLQKRINKEGAVLTPVDNYTMRAIHAEFQRRGIASERDISQPQQISDVVAEDAGKETGLEDLESEEGVGGAVDPNLTGTERIIERAGRRTTEEQIVEEDTPGTQVYTTTYGPRGSLSVPDPDSDIAYRKGRKGGPNPSAEDQKRSAAGLNITVEEYESLSKNYAARVQEEAREDAKAQQEEHGGEPNSWDPYQIPSFREFVEQNKIGLSEKAIKDKQKTLGIKERKLKELIGQTTGNPDSLLKDMTGTQRETLLASMEQVAAIKGEHNLAMTTGAESGVVAFTVTDMSGNIVEDVEVSPVGEEQAANTQVNEALETLSRKYNIPDDQIAGARRDARRTPVAKLDDIELVDVPGSGGAISVPRVPVGTMNAEVVKEVMGIIHRIAGPEAQATVANIVVDPTTNTPQLGLQAQNVVAVSLQDGHLDPQNRAYHEATHYLWGRDTRFFTRQQEKTIRDNTERLRKIVRRHFKELEKQPNVGPGLYERAIPEDAEGEIGELLAYASGLYNRTLDLTGKAPSEFTAPLRGVLDRLYQLFKQIKDLFTGPRIEGQRLEDVLDQIRSGQIAAQTRRTITDPTGFDQKNTALAMVRNGSPTARRSQQPYVLSGVKEYLKTTAKDTAKASEWIAIFSDPQKAKFKIKDKEWSVRKAEVESSRLLDFLNRFNPDDQVTKTQIEQYVSNNEMLLETIVYGDPMDARYNNDGQVQLQILRDRVVAMESTVARYIVLENPSVALASIARPAVHTIGVTGSWQDLVTPDLKALLRKYGTTNEDILKSEVTTKEIVDYLSNPENNMSLSKIGQLSGSFGLDEFELSGAGMSPQIMDYMDKTNEARQDMESFENSERDDLGDERSYMPEAYPAFTLFGHRGYQDNNYREVLLSAPALPGAIKKGQKGELLWNGDHFQDVNNVIVFMRLTDLMTEDGKKILIVEEIQSDLHQKARDEMMKAAAKDIYDKDFEALSRAEKNVIRSSPNLPRYEKEVYGPVVPDAPFKKTAEWTNLAVGHIVRMAGNGGYDGIAIANSELQMERYRHSFKNHIAGLSAEEIVLLQDISGMEISLPTEDVTSSEDLYLNLDFNPQLMEKYYGDEVVTGPIQIPLMDLWPRMEGILHPKLSSPVTRRRLEYKDFAHFLRRVEPNRAYTYLDEATKDVAEAGGTGIKGALTIALSEYLADNHPSMVNAYKVEYTVPTSSGPIKKGGSYFFGKDRELGDATGAGNADYGTSSLALEDWLGKDITALVQDQIEINKELTGDSFFTTEDMVSFISDKVKELEGTARDLESGANDSVRDYNRVSPLLTDSVRKAIRPDGSVDIPVDASHGQYDRQIPNLFRERLSDYLKGADKRSYKDDKQMLWLGQRSDETGELEGLQIVKEEDVGRMPPSSFYALTPEERRKLEAGEPTALQADLTAEQRDELDIAAYAAVEAGEAPVGPYRIPQDMREGDEILVSNVRNALRYFPITEEMQGLEGNYSIYDPVPAFRMAMAQAEGTTERNTFTSRLLKRLAAMKDGTLLHPLKGLPQISEYLILRGKSLGLINRTERTLKTIHHDLAPYLDKKNPKARGDSENLRKALYNYLTRGPNEGEQQLFDKLKAIDPTVAKAAERAKNMIEDIGEELVERGLLPAEKFYERRRSYLPRLYIQHVMQNPAGAKYSYLNRRKEMNEEAREVLGDIAELAPEFLVSQSIQRPLRDLAMMEFFDAVSQNRNWAIPKDALQVLWDNGNGTTQNVSALWLYRHADTMDQIARYVEAGDPNKAARQRATAERMRATAAPVVAKYAEENNLQSIKDPKTGAIDPAKVMAINTDGVKVLGSDGKAEFKRVPNGKQYGMLAGMAVHRSIFDDVITGVSYVGWGDNAAVKGMKLGRQATAIWKTLKVPLNPPTVARNTFSNMILMHLNGMPMRSILPNMYKAIQEVRAFKRGDMENSLHYREMLDRGVSEASFTEAELFRWSEDMLQFLGGVGMKDAGVFNWFKFNTWDKLAQNASNLYQTVEVVGKTAMAIDVMERRGQSADEAFLIANETLFDYSLVHPLVRQTRTSPFGIPFLTFYYKVAPLLIKTALNNPMRFAPYVALSLALPEMFKQAFDIGDDDYEAVKKMLPEFARQPGNSLPVPIRDSKGRVQFINLGYITPWGAFLEIGNELLKIGKAATGVAQADKPSLQSIAQTVGLFGGPGITLGMGLTNHDPFTGRPIVDTAEPLFVAGAEENMLRGRGQIPDAIFWTANQFMLPGFLHTDYGATTRMFDAVNGKRTARGYEGDTVTQAALRFAGLNLYNIDPNKAREVVHYAKQDLAKVEAAYKKMLKNQRLSPEERRVRVASYHKYIKQKEANLAQQLRDIDISTDAYRKIKPKK